MLPAILKHKLQNPAFFASIAFFALCGLWISLTFSMAFTSIFSATAIVAWIIARFLSAPHQRAIFSKPLAIPLLIYFALVLLTTFVTEYPKESLQGIYKTTSNILIFLVSADILSTYLNRSIFEKVLISWGAILGLDALFQYVTGADFIRQIALQEASSGMRVSASFKSYGHFATYLILQIPVIFAYGLRARIQKKFIQWYGFLLLGAVELVLLYMTRSRGAMLAFGLSFLVLLLRNRKFIMVMVIACAAFLMVWKVLPRSTVFHLNTEHQEQSMVERFVLWDRALQVIQAKPWAGTGINTYARAHDAYDKKKNWRVRNYYAHNGYLQLAAETGLPSLIAFLSFIILFLITCAKRMKTFTTDRKIVLEGILTALLAFLFMAFVDTIFHNIATILLFWIFLGYGFAIQNTLLPEEDRSAMSKNV